jgi:predicted negative regulator of RcsB-dependent stress response
VNEYLSENEQWELLKRWLRENIPWIVGGIAVAAVGLFGWRYWEARNERLALEASVRYEQVLQAFGAGDRPRALALVDELRAEHPRSGYVHQGDLVAARVFVETGELGQAAERLARVMREADDRELALIARLRLARVQLALERPDEALKTLEARDIGAFEPRFREVRGDAHYARGDREAALREYRAALAGGDASQVVDGDLLELKINDLVADRVGTQEAATAAAN